MVIVCPEDVPIISDIVDVLKNEDWQIPGVEVELEDEENSVGDNLSFVAGIKIINEDFELKIWYTQNRGRYYSPAVPTSMSGLRTLYIQIRIPQKLIIMFFDSTVEYVVYTGRTWLEDRAEFSNCWGRESRTLNGKPNSFEVYQAKCFCEEGGNAEMYKDKKPAPHEHPGEVGPYLIYKDRKTEEDERLETANVLVEFKQYLEKVQLVLLAGIEKN